MPFESIAIDYFDYAGTHYLVVVDRLSNWIEVMKTPPASAYSGSKGLIMLLRELFASSVCLLDFRLMAGLKW